MNRLSILVLFLFFAAAGHAQTEEKAYARFDRAGAIMAGARSVQAELKVTATQSVDLGRLYTSYLRDQQGVYEAWTKDIEPERAPLYQKRLEGLSTALADAVLKILNDEQRLRLRQIVLQQTGAEALEDKSVARELGLTKEQALQVAGLFGKLRKQMADYEAAVQKELDAFPQPTSFEEAQAYQLKRMEIEEGMTAEAAALEKSRRDTDVAALAVLKPAQREKWNALLGKPFRLSQR